MDHAFNREIRYWHWSLAPRFRGGGRDVRDSHLPFTAAPRALRAPVLAGNRLVGAMACRHGARQMWKGSMLMRLRQTLIGLGGLALVTACGEPAEVPAADAAPPAEAPAANILELSAPGMYFEGPSTIPSGWVTVKFGNPSGMVHFAMLERLPEGITIEDQTREVPPHFQGGFDALAAGDVDAAMAEFGQLPAWYGDMVFLGGPGLIAAGGTGEATVFLEPGRYSIECYVKSAGVFHTYDPGTGERAMLHELIVTEEDGGGVEPEASVTLSVDNAGIHIAEGAFTAGPNMVRVNYDEQMVHGNFVRSDVHVARLTPDTDLAALDAWMDWRAPDGL